MDLSEMMKSLVTKGLQPDGSAGSSSGLPTGPPSTSQSTPIQGGAPGPSAAQGSVVLPGSSGPAGHPGPPNVSGSSGSGSQAANSSTPYPNPGYVTEKLYMLLQVYLQNKGWNQPIELLQAFADMKDSAMPNAAYLQMMASRVALDSNGRLVHRENGKIILPFEHFANAVMLKHISGPHGLHLGLEATIRAVMESYTIGREQFGMEKEFIVEVVQNCPNHTCRYYKNQMHIGSTPQQYHQLPDPSASSSNRVSQQMPQTLADAANLLRASGTNTSSMGKGSSSSDFLQGNLNIPSLMGSSANTSAATAGVNASRDSASQNGAVMHNQLHGQLHAHNQLHGLDRDAAAQILKGNLSLDLANTSINDLKTVGAMLELSRAKAAAAAAANTSRSSTPAPSRAQLLAVAQQQLLVEKVARSLQQEGLLAENAVRSMQDKQQQQQTLQHLQQQQLHQQQIQQQQQQQQQLQQQQQQQQQQLQQQQQQLQQQQQQLQQQQQMHMQLQQLQQQQKHHHQSVTSSAVTDHKLADFLRANLENVENITSANKDLLALHNGAWSSHDEVASYKRPACSEAVGQEKIVRAFQEIMKNMHRMKTYVRPSMCKPYGKQSEMLQKTLEDTLLLVQALRSLLPPPQY